MDCPACKLDRAHRSHRRGVWEHLVSLAGYYPYRCHECGRRFVTRSGSSTAQPSEPLSHTEREIRATRDKSRRKNHTREYILYALGLLLFAAFLYVIAQDRSAPPPGG